MNKKYYWLKLKNDFFTDKRIKKLRTIAGGDTYTIIYLKMQLLSLKDDGYLYFDNVEDTFEEEIALEIDENVEDVKVTINFLMRNGLLEQKEVDEYELIETRQCIGSETASTIRSRKSRELKNERKNIELMYVKKVSNEMIALPNGVCKYIDNKRYSGNGEYVYDLAMCKCENCGETDAEKLVIHHNNGYSNSLEDLFLLCKKCHSNVENGNIKDLKHNRRVLPCNTNATKCNIEIEIEKEIDKDKKEINKEKRFKKPSIEEIKAYCEERNNGVNPEKFYNFYESKGWMIGKNRMKDWKASVRTWEKNANNNSYLPNWFNEEQVVKPLSKQEQEEMDALLEDFK